MSPPFYDGGGGWKVCRVPVIQRQFGHASLATTDRYLAHVSPKDVVEAMRWRE